MIVYERNGQTQEVEEREATRMRLLEQQGWQHSAQQPTEPQETGADGYDTPKSDGDIERIAARGRNAKTQRPTAQRVAAPTVDTAAQRDITGQQPTVKAGALPEDFPGYHALREAGIGTYEALRATDVAKIAGVNKATAAKVQDAIKDEPA